MLLHKGGELPGLDEYLEGNGLVIRQKAEAYLLDTVVTLCGNGDLDAVIDIRDKFKPIMIDALEQVTPRIAHDDPAWSDLPLTSQDSYDLDPIRAELGEELKEFITSFITAVHNNRIINIDLMQHFALKWQNTRLEQDFQTAVQLIDRLRGWRKQDIINQLNLATSADESNATEPADRNPKPEPQPYGVSHYGAEILVRDWLRHLGHADATETQKSSDGGIDVYTSELVVQVKNYKDAVGVPSIRELLGVSVSERKRPVMFTSGYLTSDAVDFSDQNEIPVLRYSAEDGTLVAMNVHGSAFMEASAALQVQTASTEPASPTQLFMQTASDFMRLNYALVEIANYRNANHDQFETNVPLVQTLLIEKASISPLVQGMVDQFGNLVDHEIEKLRPGSTSPFADKVAELTRELAAEVEKAIANGISIFDAFGAKLR